MMEINRKMAAAYRVHVRYELGVEFRKAAGFF
jgi:hypothetical protein